MKNDIKSTSYDHKSIRYKMCGGSSNCEYDGGYGLDTIGNQNFYMVLRDLEECAQIVRMATGICEGIRGKSLGRLAAGDVCHHLRAAEGEIK